MNLNSITKILIIRLSSLGDILLTTPLIRNLKKMYPQLEIDFLMRSEYLDLLLNNPYLKEKYVIERDKPYNMLINELKKKNYDLVVDLQNNIRTKLICSKLNVRTKKFKKPNFKKFLLVYFKINLLKEKIPIPLRYAESLGIQSLDEEGLDLFIPEGISSELDTENQYVGLCPGSRHFTKAWLTEYFIETGNKLMSLGYIPLIFGGLEDMEISMLISKEIPGSINLCNRNDLFNIALSMKKCRAVICNDSGLMHTACALKVPVIALFGSTVREFGFAPYNSKNLILENNSLSCRPCTHIGRKDCPKKHFKCMKEITPDILLQKFKSFIASS